MTEATEEPLTNDEITYIIDILLGPPEEWDEADGEFAMKLYGVPPSTIEDNVRLIENVVARFQKEDGYAPPELVGILARWKEEIRNGQTKDDSQ